MHYYHVCKSSGENKAFAQFRGSYVASLPCAVDRQFDQDFQEKIELHKTFHRELHAADAQFATLLHAELGLTTPLTGKLALNQEWKAWSTALQKVLGRTLTLAEKGEWLPHYTQHQEQQAQRRQHLAQLDRQLDQLVYQLYHLTPAEIALVEDP